MKHFLNLRTVSLVDRYQRFARHAVSIFRVEEEEEDKQASKEQRVFHA
jgi:hypothetical protein